MCLCVCVSVGVHLHVCVCVCVLAYMCVCCVGMICQYAHIHAGELQLYKSMWNLLEKKETTKCEARKSLKWFNVPTLFVLLQNSAQFSDQFVFQIVYHITPDIPQVHTEKINDEAMRDLLKLICDTYTVSCLLFLDLMWYFWNRFWYVIFKKICIVVLLFFSDVFLCVNDFFSFLFYFIFIVAVNVIFVQC